MYVFRKFEEMGYAEKDITKAIELIEVLISNGARLDLKDNDGKTTLDIAIQFSCPKKL